MGLKEAILEFYYFFEDKYYDIIDAIGEKFPPLLNIVDSIDRVFPSFLLFLLIFFGIIGFLAYNALMPKAPEITQYTLIFKDQKGSPFGRIDVKIYCGEKLLERKTDSYGRLVLTKEECPTKKIKVEALKQTKTVLLKPKTIITLVREKLEKVLRKTIMVQDSKGNPITGKQIKVRFACSKAKPPKPITTYSNVITVDFPSNCGIPSATVFVQGYVSQTQTLLADKVIFSLKSKYAALEAEEEIPEVETPKASILVTVKDFNNNALPNIRVTLYRNSNNTDFEIDSEPTGSNGTVLFSELELGLYKACARDSNGNYLEKCSGFIELSESKQYSVEITMEKNTNISKVSFIVLDANSSQPIVADVILSVYDANAGKTQLIINSQTNYDGTFEYYGIDPSKTYYAAISASGYVATIEQLQIFSKDSNNTQQIFLEKLSIDSNGNPENYANITVNVKDLADNPVSNASVYTHLDNILVNTSVTNANGTITLQGMPLGNYSFSVIHTIGHAEHTQTIDTPGSYTIDINLSGYEATVSFIVKDEGNKTSLENASVKLYSYITGELIKEGITASKVTFTLILYNLCEKFNVEVSKEGYLPYYTTIRICPNQDDSYTFFLKKDSNSLPTPKVTYLEFYCNGSYVADTLIEITYTDGSSEIKYTDANGRIYLNRPLYEIKSVNDVTNACPGTFSYSIYFSDGNSISGITETNISDNSQFQQDNICFFDADGNPLPKDVNITICRTDNSGNCTQCETLQTDHEGCVIVKNWNEICYIKPDYPEPIGPPSINGTTPPLAILYEGKYYELDKKTEATILQAGEQYYLLFPLTIHQASYSGTFTLTPADAVLILDFDNPNTDYFSWDSSSLKVTINSAPPGDYNLWFLVQISPDADEGDSGDVNATLCDNSGNCDYAFLEYGIGASVCNAPFCIGSISFSSNDYSAGVSPPYDSTNQQTAELYENENYTVTLSYFRNNSPNYNNLELKAIHNNQTLFSFNISSLSVGETAANITTNFNPTATGTYNVTLKVYNDDQEIYSDGNFTIKVNSKQELTSGKDVNITPESLCRGTVYNLSISADASYGEEEVNLYCYDSDVNCENYDPQVADDSYKETLNPSGNYTFRSLYTDQYSVCIVEIPENFSHKKFCEEIPVEDCSSQQNLLKRKIEDCIEVNLPSNCTDSTCKVNGTFDFNVTWKDNSDCEYDYLGINIASEALNLDNTSSCLVSPEFVGTKKSGSTNNISRINCTFNLQGLFDITLQVTTPDNDTPIDYNTFEVINENPNASLRLSKYT
ncbi:MAG: hypothetical protein DRO04_01010, partial [Candidatus Iainarchaeum archaeon]